ncbi:recombinase family protein [Microbacterium sp. TNHR37B]|uniref:recombinase family protein n=1 Tax=Microbacterium sp. TNHR37B TaxID=1775956 RepID=UPI0007B24647|nr:recombinase family protein [Microbacterium sp. TNHR37B]KZE91768.1 hypothetical protein AVP41_01315 [Microbacterium sp. TNHR37B]
MSDGTALRAAIYVRQSVREDQGIKQQIAECKRRVSGEEWDLVDVYNDNNTSASKARGEGTQWARMLADIDAGKVDVVVSVTAARLLRRMGDIYELQKPKRDVRVLTLRDGIDTATMGGRMMLYMLVLFAESEIEEKEARALPYRAERRKAGHPAPGLVPFGYSWVPKLQRDARGTRYAVVPGEAAVLRFMSREFLATAGLGSGALGTIAATLNAGEATDEHGEPLGESSKTTRPRLDRDGNVIREGKPWTTTTIRRMLLSPFPAALLPSKMPEGEHYNAARVDMSKCQPGAWPEILTEDAVLAARAILLNPSRRKHDGDTRAKHLLSGVGRCAVCGGPIRSAQVKTTAPDPLRAYRCTKGCFVRAAAVIEAYVTEAVVSLLSAPDLLQWVPDDGADINTLRARRVALQSDRDDAEALYREGTISAATLRAKTGKLDPEIHAVDASLAAALQADPLAEIVTSDDVRGMWDSITTARRRAILGALVHRVEVGRVGKGVRVLTVEAAEGTVSMGWKRTEHRVSLTRARSLSAGRPIVPLDAREGIAAALSA